MGEKMLGELGLEENRCTAFVGAGGKTTAVYTCVGESLQKGLLAAAVTTTKMWKPKKGFVEWKAGDSVDEIRKKIRGCGTLPLTIGTDFGNGKIGPVPEQILARLAEAGIRLFVEADGAKGKWIKRPGANEPGRSGLCGDGSGYPEPKSSRASFFRSGAPPTDLCGQSGKKSGRSGGYV